MTVRSRRLSAALTAATASFSLALLIPHQGGSVPRPPAEPLIVPAVCRAGGKVEQVFARPGDKVASGQILVRLDASALRSQRDAIASVLQLLRSRAPIPPQFRRLLIEYSPEVTRAEQRYVRALRGNAPALAQAAAQRTEARAEVARGLANLDKLSAALPSLRVRLSDLDQALTAYEIRAPRGGIVDILDLHPGDTLLPGQPAALLVISNEYAP